MTNHEENPQGSGSEPPRNNPYAQHAQAAAERAKAAAQDALGVARRLATNPVAGIGEANAGLTQDRMLGVAIVFAVVAAIGLAFAAGPLGSAVLGAMMGGYGGMPGMGFEFGAFVKSTLGNLLMIIAFCWRRFSAGAPIRPRRCWCRRRRFCRSDWPPWPPPCSAGYSLASSR
jgi:hypothetical protein